MRRLVVTCIFLLIAIVSLPMLAQQVGPQPGLETVPPPQKIDPPSPNSSAVELEQRGDDLRAQKAYIDAIDYYRAALLKGKTPVLYNKIGIAELQMDRYHDARKDFGRSIKLDKKYAEAYNNLGVIYYKLGKYGSAIKEYKKAIALQDMSASFHSNLGSAYFAQKLYDIAAVEYGRALQLDPDIFDRISGVGVAAHLQSPQDKAYFSYVLARMYAQMGNYDRSLKCLQRAIEDGYDVKGHVYKDENFAKLREDPRFAELMSSKTVAIPE
jgi:tetratricopeptide (TPR) repeat protein